MKNKITLSVIFLFFLCRFSFAQINFIRQQNVPVVVGTSTLQLPWAGGLSYPMFSEFDFNMDGIMDLFCFDRANNRIIPFINNGTPNQASYTYAPEYVKYFPDPRSWAFTYDFDCDGKNDFFTLSDTYNGIKVYKNVSTTPGSLEFTLFSPMLMSQYPTTYTNLFASYGLVPALSDIDNDGDVDILCWNTGLGGFVEYDKNMSVEHGHGCDSLEFNYVTSCWGNFALMTSVNKAQLGITCRVGFDPHDPLGGYDQSDAARHDDTMSSICILDIEGDGDKDLLVGGLADSNSLLLVNGGTPAAANMVSQDTLFPSYDYSSQVISFTTHAYIDVDNDGKKDIIVSPTYEEDFAGIWLYKDTSTTSVPAFHYQTNSFLQHEMIETGSGAYPAFFDYDGDGLLDMVIGNYTYYQSLGGFKSGISVYRNVGTNTSPSFQLITRNYANIFSYTFNLGYGNDVHPTFGDIDGDGDMDMIIGDYDGKLQYFENTGGAGNPAIFSTVTGPNYQNIDIGSNAAPQLVDLNRDGLLDLVIGRKNGFISYYQNTGTSSSPIFTLVHDSLGHVDVSYNSSGYASPFVFDDGGSYKMLVSNELGYVFLYGNIDGNLNGTFTRLDTVMSRTEGNRINIAMGDINGDGVMDLLVGNYDGGVALFYRDNPLAVNSPSIVAKPSFEIFPNPAEGNVFVQLSNLNRAAKNVLSIFNATGEKVFSVDCKSISQTIDISKLSAGLYIVRLDDGKDSVVRKLLVY